MRGNTFLIVLLVLLSSFVAPPSRAADQARPRVGRVSAVEGGLAVRQPAAEWADSAVNEPIAGGMALRTPPQGQAVLRIGAETIALAGGTEAELAQLDGSGTQLVLRRGRIGVRLSRLDPARSIEIDIPRGGVWLLTPGDYEIAAGDEHAPARLVVLDGRARFVGGGLDSAIAAGTAKVVQGMPAQESREDAVADAFTDWWRMAGGAADPEALRHVSPGMTGYEALDGNGSWQTVGGYGAVWFPDAATDSWAPYRNGRWRWIAAWGWTWIDDMKWAFAPTHYGRWVRFPEKDAPAASEPAAERWGWVPGKLAAEPVFAPALVAFLGTAGIGLSCPGTVGPAVAWFPLAPGEAYWPPFTSDPDAIRRLNAASVPGIAGIGDAVDGQPPGEIVNGDYRNRRFARAVPRSVFIGGRPVAASLLQLPERRLDNAPLLAGSPQIAPPAARSPGETSARAVLAQAAPRLRNAVGTLARILSPRAKPAGLSLVALARPARPTPVASGAVLARPTLVAAIVRQARARLADAHQGHIR